MIMCNCIAEDSLDPDSPIFDLCARGFRLISQIKDTSRVDEALVQLRSHDNYSYIFEFKLLPRFH